MLIFFGRKRIGHTHGSGGQMAAIQTYRMAKSQGCLVSL
jgi:hypothetical protein